MDDKEYKLFRSWVPLRVSARHFSANDVALLGNRACRFPFCDCPQTVCVDQTSDMTWSYYEYGPEEVDPIVFLPAGKGGEV